MNQARTPVQEAISHAMAEHLSPEKMMARLLMAKLKEAGLRLSAEEKKDVQDVCEKSAASDDWSALNALRFERRGSRHINLTLGDDEIEKHVAKVSARLEKAMPRVLLDLARQLYGNFRMNAEQGRIAHRVYTEHFKNRLGRTYSAAFRAFGRFLIACVNINHGFLTDMSTKGGPRRTAKRSALVRLHHRACRVATEIECLLQAGLGDGALARWRTLHEVCVSAMFIAKQSNDVAARFLKHEAHDRTKIERRAAVKAAQDTTEIDQVRASLEALYGENFTKDYGWAANVLKKKTVNLIDLEKAIEFEHGRLPYTRASSVVHGSALGLFYRPAMNTLTEPGNPMEWSIGSNIGISGPADLCAWSLLNTSVALLGSHETADNVVLMKLLSKAKGEVSAAFSAAEKRIMKRHEKWLARVGHPV